MASETASARTILNTLSTLPLIHSVDTVPDPRHPPTLSAPILPRMPKPYTIATNSSTSTGTSKSSKVLIVSIKPLRPIPTLPAGSSLDLEVGADTSIYELKQLVARRTGYEVGKVKVLLEKGPVGDSKTVGEIGSGKASALLEPGQKMVLEFSAMFTGAPTETPQGEEGSGGEQDVRMQTADEASLDAARKADVGQAGGVEGASGSASTKDVEMTEGDTVPVAQGKSGKDVLETEEFWEDFRGFVVQRSRDEKVAEILTTRCKEGWKGWIGSR